MEKKYYFRGLGLGIIVTALIMGIAVSRGEKREMTDTEIIARAKELGMTENTRLLEDEPADESQEDTEPAGDEEQAKAPVKKDVSVAQPKDDVTSPSQEETEPADSGEDKPAAGTEPAAGSASDQSASNQAGSDKKPAADTNEMTKQDDDAVEPPKTEEPAAEKPSQQTPAAASITIVSGDGSYTVAKKLEEAGVVSSASLYDDYLCRNGYDKRLRTGTFQIPAGASDDEIAKIVTGQP